MRFATCDVSLFVIFLSGILFSSTHFETAERSSDIIRLNFSLDNIEFAEAPDGMRIFDASAGTTLDSGYPELPVYSTMIQLQPEISYEVTCIVNSVETMTDIHLAHHTPGPEQLANNQYLPAVTETGSGVYPAENLIMSDPIIMRGLELMSISLIPFSYNAEEETLEIWHDAELVITPDGTRPATRASQMPRSRIFEPLYEYLLDNYEPPERSEYQQPAVLYICGGGSNGAIVHPYFQQLVEWRHKRGFVVYTAHTGQTGSSANQIKNYIEDAYETFDPPPEIVGLVGDVSGSFDVPTFYENWSWYSGEGDHPYTELEGNDIFPEVLVGRISVYNSSDLANVINKTLSYERAGYMGNNWFEKAALVGDPNDSGISTADANYYVEQLMEEIGMDDIRIKTSGSSWASWMENQLEEGVLYFNYRGWGLFSGFSSSNINNANNGYMNPFVTFITCGTGSFASGTALTEDFIRAGTLNNPKGSVTAIGTATLGTHTVYNNIVDMGVFEGILSHGVETAGAALATGHLALYRTYPWDPNNNVSVFTHWNNLMGDPALMLWTDTPEILEVNFPETLTAGVNFVEILVEDTDGNPVENAVVTLTSEVGDDVFISARTADTGIAGLNLDPDYVGTVNVTVTGRNLKPVESVFVIETEGPSVNFEAGSAVVLDLSGNGDGLLNPGEEVQLELSISNFGDAAAAGISAALTAESELVNILDGPQAAGDLASGESAAVAFNVVLDSNMEEGHDIDFRLSIEDTGGHAWLSRVPVQVFGADLMISDFYFSQGSLNPGETGSLMIELTNLGSVPIAGISGELLPENYLLESLSGECSWPEIPAGGSAFVSTPFEIAASSDIINGSVIHLPMQLTDANGYEKEVTLSLTLGTVTVEDPLGPDQYGYFIYDSSDLGYNLAHPYDWLEIDPDYGGDGSSVNLSDNGNGLPSSQTPAHRTLPFTFTFYGVDYDQITISSNGWISFGHRDSRSFRNYSIPGAGGPSAMVAAFWDDLTTSGSGAVYYYESPQNDFVVIEWSDMRTYNQNSLESFQIILYDAVTPTGDDEILIQYKEFNNTTTGDLDWGGIQHGSYCTIGIENHTGNDGLEYSYNNEYPEAALPVTDETALFITTRQPIALLMGDVNQDSDLNVLDVVAIVNHILHIQLLDALGIYVADINQDGMVSILDIISIIVLITT